MLHLHKNYFFIFSLIFFSIFIKSEQDPYLFIDKNAQKMVEVLIINSDLFESNRSEYEYKIKEILTDIPISAVDNHENWLKIGFAIIKL